MACVDDSIDRFVADICVVADLNAFSQCATKEIAFQSSEWISYFCRFILLQIFVFHDEIIYDSLII